MDVETLMPVPCSYAQVDFARAHPLCSCCHLSVQLDEIALPSSKSHASRPTLNGTGFCSNIYTRSLERIKLMNK